MAFERIAPDTPEWAAHHATHFSPFIRLGLRMQRVLRGCPRPLPALAEQLEDFEIAALESAAACDVLGEGGPFVLIAVAWS